MWILIYVICPQTRKVAQKQSFYIGYEVNQCKKW